MRAILKEPGKEPKIIDVGESQAELFEAVGGAYDKVPALFGAMALCRAVDVGLPENCHFLGRVYYGNVLVVGRGKGDKPVDLPPQLQRILMLAFGGSKK